MLPQDPFIRQLGQLDRASPQFSDHLTTLLGEGKNLEHIFNLSAQDILWLTDYLDNILYALNSASRAFKECLCVLVWICKTRRILPRSYTLSDKLLITSPHPVPSGVLADVCEGTLDGFKVCVKQPRTYSTCSSRDMSMVHMSFQEAVIWKHAKHPNIVPFLGVTSTPLQLVSSWMPGGNVMEYIKQHPGADRLALLLDVAEALHYLHSRNVVHGDLKGPSILVDDAGRACLTDFGLATVTPDLEPAVSIHKYYSIRWTAPEILRGEVGTKETDVYAFGMIVIEITSGTAPFADSSPTSVAAKVMMGKRPERPKDQILTNGLWTLTKRCLEGDPQRRPEITEVIYYLRKTLTSLQDYADGSDLATSDDTTLGSAQKRELLYHTCCSIPGCQLWRRCKSKRLLSENRPTSDSIGSVKSREPDTREGIASIIGKHPKQPVHSSFTDRLWELTQSRWNKSRPWMDRAIKQLRGSAREVPQITLTRPFKPPGCKNPEMSPSTAAYMTMIRKTTALSPSPPLPQAPATFFGRDAIIGDLLGLVEQSTSVILSGVGGIGKTTIALELLHHVRTAARFGKHRYFVRCDGLDSLNGFHERLSETIGALNLRDMGQLRLHSSLSSPCLLVLDCIDCILSPVFSGTAGIIATIEEFGRCQNICLLATSRIDVNIPEFRRIEVPTLSVDGSRDAFHSRCCLPRSVTVDKLLEQLDFHPLSIVLLASVVRENNWDEPTLLEAWNAGKANIPEESVRQSLEDFIQLFLGTSTIQELGATALGILEALAAFPDGVEESRLEIMFPRITGVGEATDVLCKFSLIYRRDGLVRMLPTLRFCFLESMQTLFLRPGSDTSHYSAAKDIHCTRRDVAKPGGPPVDTNTEPPKNKPSGFTELHYKFHPTHATPIRHHGASSAAMNSSSSMCSKINLDGIVTPIKNEVSELHDCNTTDMLQPASEPPKDINTKSGQQPGTPLGANSIEKIRSAKRKLLAILRLSGGSNNLNRTQNGAVNVEPASTSPS